MSQQRSGTAGDEPPGTGPVDGFPDLPEATVARLPEYLRALHNLAEAGHDTVSSEGLAGAAGVNSAKLRKDLSHLGSYGTRGVGYDVDAADRADRIHPRPDASAARSRSSASVTSVTPSPVTPGFASRGFRIAALFDADPSRVGEKINGLAVHHIDDLAEVVAAEDIAIAVIATPAPAAQSVVDELVACGVTSILNFAPCVLSVPGGVDVRKVDLAIELQILSFHEHRKASLTALAGAAAGGRPDIGGGRHVNLLVVGVSHRTASVAVLERLAASPQDTPHLLTDLMSQPYVGEAMVLSTCNRVEIYAGVTAFHGGLADIAAVLAARLGATAGRSGPAYVRALRRRRRPARVPGRDRPRLDGRRRGADPRAAPRRVRARDRARHRRAPDPRPDAAGAAGRQAGARRDRHRPRRPEHRLRRARRRPPTHLPTRRHRRRRPRSSSAPARWARSRSPRCAAAVPVSCSITNRDAARADRLAELHGATAVPFDDLAAAVGQRRSRGLRDRRARARARPRRTWSGRWSCSTWPFRATSTRASATLPGVVLLDMETAGRRDPRRARPTARSSRRRGRGRVDRGGRGRRVPDAAARRRRRADGGRAARPGRRRGRDRAAPARTSGAPI